MRIVPLVGAFVCGLLVAAACSVVAQEPTTAPQTDVVQFDTPQAADPGASRFAPSLVCLDWRRQEVMAEFWEVAPADNAFVLRGKHLRITWAGNDARDLMVALNTMDFSPPAKPFRQRVILKAQQDGKVGSGAIQ